MNLVEVKKPWALFSMALWTFFGFGGFLSSLTKVMFSNNETLLQIVFCGIISIVIALIYFLLKFNRKALMIFAALSFALALFQVFNIARILLTIGFNPIIYFLLFYVIPSIFLGWLAVTKKYLSLATQYEKYKKQQDKYKEQEAMRKTALKASRR